MAFVDVVGGTLEDNVIFTWHCSKSALLQLTSTTYATVSTWRPSSDVKFRDIANLNTWSLLSSCSTYCAHLFTGYLDCFRFRLMVASLSYWRIRLSGTRNHRVLLSSLPSPLHLHILLHQLCQSLRGESRLISAS